MTKTKDTIVVSGDFDDIRPQNFRLLQEASRFGRLHIFLWDDAFLRSAAAKEPKFPEQERLYYLKANRFVHQVHLVHGFSDANTLPLVTNVKPAMWVVHESEHTPQKQAYCDAHTLDYKVLTTQALEGFPDYGIAESTAASSRKKVLVTGCFDWFHSGHVRFFEEISELGELYVVVGHDANIRALKGSGHPMFNEQQRLYMVQSIRYVKQAMISTGDGWLDAEPEIERIKPDMYVVNEDGDKQIKKNYCQQHGIEYVVLKRLPKPGLSRRTSTILRGF